MSLVNLSHVCSHLQNASLAKLGLTSIPYTQLHLSLSLLLQKQGFLSQVKLGGPSPPASCFPPGSVRPQMRITDDTRSKANIPPEHRFKSKEQLRKDGWDSVAANFLIRHDGIPLQDLKDAETSDEELEIIETHAPMLSAARDEVRKWLPEPDPRTGEHLQERGQQEMLSDQRRRDREDIKLKSLLLREGFSINTLQHFAGPENSLRTIRDLERDGITISTMGIDIHNQPYDPPSAPDLDDLDTEGVVTQANRSTRRLWLGMKYWDGTPVLKKARMLSKPTKRMWLNAQEISGLVRGKGAFKEQIKPLTQVGEIMVISTDRGIMEVRECAERRIGGMVLCRIW